MLVAVNCAIALRGMSGSHRALTHILAALDKRDDIAVEMVWPPKARASGRLANAARQARWDLYGACRAAKTSDVLVSPCNIGMANARLGHVLVLHDTMVLDYGNLYDAGYATYARLLFGASVGRASVILVPSEYTRRRVQERWSPECEVSVARWPVRPQRRRASRVAQKTVILVGATEPLKRQELGIEAVRRLRSASGEDIRLDIIGPEGRAEPAVQRAVKVADPYGRWTARRCRVNDDELAEAYSTAWLIMQPSVCEGYGLPVAEAAAVGLPAVHSGGGALSEVAPGAVHDPNDPGAYASRAHALLDDVTYHAAEEAAIRAALTHSPAAFERIVCTAVYAANAMRH